MRRKGIFIAVVIFFGIWGILTVWVQQERDFLIRNLGDEKSDHKALILFNPDPFYNLDEQLGLAFGQAISEDGWYVTIGSIETAGTIDLEAFDLFVFCANTYNWAPDRPTQHFIEQTPFLGGKDAALLTLGSGSTDRSMRILEKQVANKGARVLTSTSYWLMKPNAEEGDRRSNIAIATSKAFEQGKETSRLVKEAL